MKVISVSEDKYGHAELTVEGHYGKKRLRALLTFPGNGDIVYWDGMFGVMKEGVLMVDKGCYRYPDKASVQLVIMPGQVLYYGCVKCQSFHHEFEPAFAQHIPWQDKHGIRV